MTQREELKAEILKHLYVPSLIACSCGHDYVTGNGYDGGMDDVAEHMADIIANLLEPEWRKFDKDDASTWPEERGEYWLTLLDEGRVSVTHGHWEFHMQEWSSVTHWKSIEVPSVPLDVKEQG